jgi:hypothetical protein
MTIINSKEELIDVYLDVVESRIATLDEERGMLNEERSTLLAMKKDYHDDQ